MKRINVMVKRSRISQSEPRRGAATVELAVCLPFLIFMFLGLLDYGRIFYGALTINNCNLNAGYMAADANSGNQYPYTDVQTAANKEPVNFAGTTSLPGETANSPTNGTDSKGNTTETVSITYNFDTISKFPGLPTVTNMTRTLTVRQAPANAN